VTAANSGDARLLGGVRLQLVLWTGGIVLVVLLALGLILTLAVAGSLASSGTAQLQERADQLTDALRDRPGRRDPIGRPEVGIAVGGRSAGTFAFVIPPSGEIIRPPNLDLPPELPDEAAIVAVRTSGGTDVRTESAGGTPFRILSEGVESQGTVYVVQVAQDITAERQTLTTLVTVLAVGGVLALLAALAAGALVARRALVPIRDALRRQREFAADASHELRTPLAVVRASAEHLQRNPDRPVHEVGTAVDDITAEVDHMTGLVEDLLLLARSDSGAVELAREPVELAEVATDAAAGLTGLAAKTGVALAVDPERVEVTGDPARLRQLVTILVDNGIRHGPSGGTVTVTVRRDGNLAALTVDDDGPGIPQADRERVFDRFWRSPEATTGGTGLGLAIAAWIVDQHHGTIAATDRPGGGSRFVARLPVA